MKPGASLELLDVEKFHQVMDRSLLSPVLCGLLNTRLGGKIFVGVKRCGLIRGIVLERKKRDLASYLIYLFLDFYEGQMFQFGPERVNFKASFIMLTRLTFEIFLLQVRQLLDRIFNNNINPRVGPNLVDVDFVRVVDKKLPRLELHLVVMTVQGQARDKVFSVQGIHPEINGTYTRKESRSENNVKMK